MEIHIFSVNVWYAAASKPTIFNSWFKIDDNYCGWI